MRKAGYSPVLPDYAQGAGATGADTMVLPVLKHPAAAHATVQWEWPEAGLVGRGES